MRGEDKVTLFKPPGKQYVNHPGSVNSVLATGQSMWGGFVQEWLLQAGLRTLLDLALFTKT